MDDVVNMQSRTMRSEKKQSKESGHTILCTWEIGSELGHISRFSAIVHALESQNFNVVVALKDLSRAYPFFSDTKATLLQAPVWLPQISMQRPIACLPDSMLLLGYLETDPLHSLVSAWQSLIELVNPDLVIFDYSPTAMLALQDVDVPKVLVGHGFADPVTGQPIADWRPYNAKDNLVERQEKRVLQQVNEILIRQQKKTLENLSDLFRVNKTFITTFPELDLYGQLRHDADYCVGSSDVPVTKKVTFTQNTPHKILAYLKPAYPQLNMLLDALDRCEADVFISCPQMPAEYFKKYQREGFQISTELVDLEAAMDDADLFIGHGNAATTKESIRAGTPLMVFPIQLEQLINGKLVEEAGCGQLHEKIENADSVVKAMTSLLGEPESYQQAINALLSRHKSSLQRTLPQAVLDFCQQVLGK